MRGGRRVIAGAIGAAGASLALAAPIALGGVERAAMPIVQVQDDFFSPVTLSVKEDTKVKFKWSPDNTNPHNVVLKKGPSGVKAKDFKSPAGSIGVKYAPTFEKRGTYDLLCTFHPEVMKLKVNVKR